MSSLSTERFSGYATLRDSIDAGDILLWRGNYIGKGADSDVYVSPDRSTAIKLYFRQPDLSKLMLYSTVTDSAIALIAKSGWSVSTTSFGDLNLRVVPLDLLFRSNMLNCYVAFCEFVEGPNCDEDLTQLRWINREDYKNLERQLGKLSKRLDLELKVQGISLVTSNAKVVGRELVVTDLCATIDMLESNKPHQRP